MKIIKKEPTDGKSNGEVLLYGLNKEEFDAACEEVDMINELTDRLKKARKDEEIVKKK